MKKLSILIAIIMISLVGCDEAKKISASEFKNQYRLRNTQTMHHAEYLGQKDGKAYMKIRSMSSLNSKKWSEKIVYVELDELDDQFKASLPKKVEKNKQTISTGEELLPAIKQIPVGKTGWLQVEGKLTSYSGSFPKGKGLAEISIGSKTLLINPLALHKEQEKAFLGKTISARVKISHFPLPDDKKTQLQGHWITDIKDLKVLNPCERKIE